MKSREGAPPLLVPLACPVCGGDLDAGPGDRVGLCLPCGRAIFLDGKMASFRTLWLAPAVEQPRARLHHLPFWRVEGRAALDADPQKARMYTVPIDRPLMFPAFWMPRIHYMDDLTWRYLVLKEEPRELPDRVPMPGGVRDPSILGEMARLALLGYMDRIADVGDVGLAYEVKRITYVGVPFWKTSSEWVEGLCGVKLPHGLLAP